MRAEKVDTEIRREQIAQAALDLIAIYGMKGLTNKKIAGMVGIVPSALYKHFKNKAQIIDAIIDLMVKSMRSLVNEATKIGDNPIECIKRFYLAECRMIAQTPGAPFILFSDEVFGEKNKRKTKFMEAARLHFEELTNLFRRALEKKQIRQDFSPETLAVFYMGLVSQTGFLVGRKTSAVEIFQHCERAWKAFRDMLNNW